MEHAEDDAGRAVLCEVLDADDDTGDEDFVAEEEAAEEELSDASSSSDAGEATDRRRDDLKESATDWHGDIDYFAAVLAHEDPGGLPLVEEELPDDSSSDEEEGEDEGEDEGEEAGDDQDDEEEAGCNGMAGQARPSARPGNAREGNTTPLDAAAPPQGRQLARPSSPAGPVVLAALPDIPDLPASTLPGGGATHQASSQGPGPHPFPVADGDWVLQKLPSLDGPPPPLGGSLGSGEGGTGELVDGCSVAVVYNTRARCNLRDVAIEELERALDADWEEEPKRAGDEEEYERFLRVLRGEAPEALFPEDGEEDDEEFGAHLSHLFEGLEGEGDASALEPGETEAAGEGSEVQEGGGGNDGDAGGRRRRRAQRRALPARHAREMATQVLRAAAAAATQDKTQAVPSAWTAAQTRVVYWQLHIHCQLLLQVHALVARDPGTEAQRLAAKAWQLIQALDMGRHRAVNVAIMAGAPVLPPALLGMAPSVTSSHGRDEPGESAEAQSTAVAAAADGLGDSSATAEAAAPAAKPWSPAVLHDVRSVLDVAPLRKLRQYHHAMSQVPMQEESALQELAELDAGTAVVRKRLRRRHKLGPLERVWQSVSLPTLDAAMPGLLDPTLYYQPGPTVPRQYWSPGEDELLALGISRFGSDWGQVCATLLPHKTLQQVFVRQKNLAARKKGSAVSTAKSKARGPLTADEVPRVLAGLTALLQLLPEELRHRLPLPWSPEEAALAAATGVDPKLGIAPAGPLPPNPPPAGQSGGQDAASGGQLGAWPEEVAALWHALCKEHFPYRQPEALSRAWSEHVLRQREQALREARQSTRQRPAAGAGSTGRGRQGATHPGSAGPAPEAATPALRTSRSRAAGVTTSGQAHPGIAGDGAAAQGPASSATVTASAVAPAADGQGHRDEAASADAAAADAAGHASTPAGSSMPAAGGDATAGSATAAGLPDAPDDIHAMLTSHLGQLSALQAYRSRLAEGQRARWAAATRQKAQRDAMVLQHLALMMAAHAANAGMQLPQPPLAGLMSVNPFVLADLLRSAVELQLTTGVPPGTGPPPVVAAAGSTPPPPPPPPLPTTAAIIPRGGSGSRRADSASPPQGSQPPQRGSSLQPGPAPGGGRRHHATPTSFMGAVPPPAGYESWDAVLASISQRMATPGGVQGPEAPQQAEEARAGAEQEAPAPLSLPTSPMSQLDMLCRVAGALQRRTKRKRRRSGGHEVPRPLGAPTHCSAPFAGSDSEVEEGDGERLHLPPEREVPGNAGGRGACARKRTAPGGDCGAEGSAAKRMRVAGSRGGQPPRPTRPAACSPSLGRSATPGRAGMDQAASPEAGVVGSPGGRSPGADRSGHENSGGFQPALATLLQTQLLHSNGRSPGPPPGTSRGAPCAWPQPPSTWAATSLPYGDDTRHSMWGILAASGLLDVEATQHGFPGLQPQPHAAPGASTTPPRQLRTMALETVVGSVVPGHLAYACEDLPDSETGSETGSETD